VNILVITPGDPFSEKGGLPMYTRQMIESLYGDGNNISILSLVDVNKSNISSSPSFVNQFTIEETSISKGFAKISSVFSSNSFNYKRFLSGMKSNEKLFSEQDVIIVNHRLSLAVISFFNSSDFKGKVVYVNHNDELKSILSIAGYINNPIVRFLARREAYKVFYEELMLFKYCDGVSFINADDMESYSSALSNIKTSVIPVYIELNKRENNETDAKNFKNILLVGSFDWLPKKKNAEWVINSIFPLVRQSVKDARLFIVGKAADQLNVKVENVEIHSDVKDVEPYYSEAKVFVIPEKQAGGLKIKSVEAALNKVPIVSSSFGVSGTEFLNMRDCITCKLTAESFAESIIRLLESESLQAEISNNAYEKALKLFSKTAVELKWKSFWNRVF
jgi:glycosyltransferase involved in cell wall biosynthesis